MAAGEKVLRQELELQYDMDRCSRATLNVQSLGSGDGLPAKRSRIVDDYLSDDEMEQDEDEDDGDNVRTSTIMMTLANKCISG